MLNGYPREQETRTMHLHAIRIVKDTHSLATLAIVSVNHRVNDVKATSLCGISSCG
jgi:hypothetical protein